MPVIEPHKMRNPYVFTLVDKIKSKYNDVSFTFGHNLFWSSDILSYDIMHIQWPNELLYDDNNNHYTIDEVAERIKYLQGKGLKVITTCHNLTPHYSNSNKQKTIYDTVYSLANVILHLGKFSQHLFEEKYPHAKNVLLYHHVYDHLYSPTQLTRERCLSILGLDKRIRYVLCMGAFRSKEEREMVLSVNKRLRKHKIEILAPTFIPISEDFSMVHRIYGFLKKSIANLIYPHLHIIGYPVSDELMPIYYKASDVALIQRLHILNSGNVLMGLLMEKVVVGPDVGNVGTLLKEMGNPVFESNNSKSIASLILNGIDDMRNGLGKRNRNFAVENFGTSVVSEKLYNIYKFVK